MSSQNGSGDKKNRGSQYSEKITKVTRDEERERTASVLDDLPVSVPQEACATQFLS